MTTSTIGRLTVALLLLLFVAATAPAADGSKQIIGTVTRCDQSSIDIRTRDGRTVSVKRDANTIYRTWIASKRWRLDANASMVAAGRLVAVELSGGDSSVARVVYIGP